LFACARGLSPSSTEAANRAMAYTGVHLVDVDVEECQHGAEPSHTRAPRARFGSGAVGVAAMLSLTSIGCALAICQPRASRAHEERALTAHGFLLSDQMTDLTTENLRALQGEALAASGREQLREEVRHGLLRIDAALEQLQPEAHRQLRELELDGPQRASAVHALRRLGDPRLVRLSQAVTRAVDEAARLGGGDGLFDRHVVESLSSHVADLAQLSAEGPAESPGAAGASVSAGGAPAAAGGGRLASLDGVSDGVNAHAQALFESLEGGVGERMPTAPARMLSMLSLMGKAHRRSGSSAQPSLSGQGHHKFMPCVMDAVPHPTKVAKCISDNMSEVMHMVARFIKGTPA